MFAIEFPTDFKTELHCFNLLLDLSLVQCIQNELSYRISFLYFPLERFLLFAYFEPFVYLFVS